MLGVNMIYLTHSSTLTPCTYPSSSFWFTIYFHLFLLFLPLCGKITLLLASHTNFSSAASATRLLKSGGVSSWPKKISKPGLWRRTFFRCWYGYVFKVSQKVSPCAQAGSVSIWGEISCESGKRKSWCSLLSCSLAASGIYHSLKYLQKKRK